MTLGMEKQFRTFRFSLYFDVTSVLSDPRLDSVWLHSHFKHPCSPRKFVRTILTKPSLSTIREINTWALVLTVVIIVVVVTTWNPLHSLLFNQCAVNTCVDCTATHIFIFHSNVVTVVVQRFILVNWDVNEKKALALTCILNLKVLLSEPLNLVGHHTTEAWNVQAIGIACVEKP